MGEEGSDGHSNRVTHFGDVEDGLRKTVIDEKNETGKMRPARAKNERQAWLVSD